MANQGKVDGLQLDGISCWKLWQQTRKLRPLVQCITNFVSMDIMANTLLAAGASPAMAHSLDEVEDFVSISSALLINMGTLSSEWVASKKLAAKKAVSLGKPWVLDPVGCGATPTRTRACLELLQCQPTVVRGNASEIMALSGAAGQVQGVDSTQQSSDALQHAKALAQQYKFIVAVSGKVDYVTDGEQVACVHNGVEMLTLITAAGCSLTAVIAAFLVAAPQEPLMATAHALAAFGLAGENGYQAALQQVNGDASRVGPGSLRVGLLDALHTIPQQVVEARVKVNWLEIQ